MMSRGKRNILMNVYFLVSAACIMAADQATKHLITLKIPVNSSLEIVPGFLYITHVRNSGAAFGMFQSYTRVLTIISIVAIVLIILLKSILKLNSVFYNISLGFILGGALGNLVDRYLVGEVTDFINFKFFPVFNVADSFIFIGFFLIIILILKEYLKGEKTKRS